MLESPQISDIASARLASRWVADPREGGYYRLRDGSAVYLSDAEWRRICADYRITLKRSSRQMNIGLVGALPIALFCTAVVGPVIASVGDLYLERQGVRMIGLAFFAAILLGIPILAMRRSARINRRALAWVEADLASRPRCAMPDLPNRRLLTWIEILAAPAVFTLTIQLIGTLWPDAYRHSPFMGIGLNWLGGLAILVLAAIFALRARYVRQLARCC